MNLLLNLLKAFGITLGACLILTGAPLAAWLVVGCLKGPPLRDFGMKDSYILVNPLPPLAFFIFLFSLAFGALYLPPKGRIYAVVGALALVLGIALWVGIRCSSLVAWGGAANGGG